MSNTQEQIILTRKMALAILKKIGYQTADNWTDEKIADRLSTLDEMELDVRAIRGKNARTSIQRLMEMTKKGAWVVIGKPEFKSAAVPKKKKKKTAKEEPKPEAPKRKQGRPPKAKAAEEPVTEDKPKRRGRGRPPGAVSLTTYTRSRIAISGKLIGEITKGSNNDQLIEAADAEYAKNGGKSNLAEAKKCHHMALSVLVVIGLVTVDTKLGTIDRIASVVEGA